MSDVVEQLFDLAECDPMFAPLLVKSAKDILLLRKQVADLQTSAELEREKSQERLDLLRSARHKIMLLKRELALSDPGPHKTFKVIYCEHSDDRSFKSARIIDSQRLGACWMAEEWLLREFQQLVDEVGRQQKEESDERHKGGG